MKSSKQIQQQIEQLQQQLQKTRQRELEQRLTRFMSALDKTGLSDDEAIAALERAAAETKGAEQ